MTIAEMHVWFRQYAQQMGMQNTRAILPEQIDNLINTATKDIIDEVINRNVGTTNDRVITDNSKLANINALRTLYKVKTLVVGDENTVASYGNNPYKFDSSEIGEVLYFVDFAIRYSNNTSTIDAKRTAYEAAVTAYNTAKAASDADPTDATKKAAADAAKTAMDAALADYKNTIESDEGITRWFPIRTIDDAFLADVLNDWVLAPRMRTPAMVVYASDTSVLDSQFELYVGENQETGISTIAATKHIAEIRCSYIKTPAKVTYVSDVGGQNVDSDLPEQLQIPMLKHAVDLYRVSVAGSLYSAQQANQAQAQELARNNARPDNDGYQS